MSNIERYNKGFFFFVVEFRASQSGNMTFVAKCLAAIIKCQSRHEAKQPHTKRVSPAFIDLIRNTSITNAPDAATCLGN